MANLVETGRPYLHMRAGTFINNLSREYKNNGKHPLKLDSAPLLALIAQAEAIERDFFKDFHIKDGITHEEKARIWSDKNLAREGKGADAIQIALSIWNSRDFRNKLYGRKEDSEIKAEFENRLQKIEPNITLLLEKELQITKNVENAIGNILKELLIGKDLKTQRLIRKSLGQEVERTRKVKTGTTVIPKLIELISFENKNNQTERIDNCYYFFKERVFKKLKENQTDVPNNISLDDFLSPFKQEISQIIKLSKNDVTGAVAEKGELISLQLRYGVNIARSTGTDLIERIEVNNKVKQKTDMIIKEKYRIQQKNTDKDLFLEFEKLGQQAMQNEKLFFTAGSALSFSTFRKQVERALGGEAGTLDILEYLLVNINALNKGYQEEFGRGPMLYKKDTQGLGIYPRFAMKMLSDIVSQYCQVFFSDLIEDLNKGKIEIRSYDFVIFNSRILIPMSTIYKGFLINITDAANKINKESTYLDVETVLKTKDAFSRDDYENMVKAKEAAVKRFIPSADYSSSKLVTAGKNAGANLLSKIKIGSFIPNVNLASLIPKIDY